MILGECTCGKPILQDFNDGHWRFGSCLDGHGWRERRGKLVAVQDMPDEEPPQRVEIIPASQHEARIPEPPEWMRWVYGHAG